jgi:hypothetical protein
MAKAKKPKNPKNPSSEPIQRAKPTAIGGDWHKRGLMTPRLELVHDAFKNKNINLEEAQDLNPKYTGIESSTYNKRKRLGVKLTKVAPLDRGIGKIPETEDVHKAVIHGHIDMEQAKDINPKYTGRNPQTELAVKNKIKKGGVTPNLKDVHEAVKGGHIHESEGEALNPKYADPTSKLNAARNLKYQPGSNRMSRQFTQNK